MTVFSIIKAILELSAIALLCYGVYREKDLIKFERKVFKYVKAFVLSCAYSIRDKFKREKKTGNVISVDTSAYEEMLVSLNKSSNVYDVQFAS